MYSKYGVVSSLFKDIFSHDNIRLNEAAHCTLDTILQYELLTIQFFFV